MSGERARAYRFDRSRDVVGGDDHGQLRALANDHDGLPSMRTIQPEAAERVAPEEAIAPEEAPDAAYQALRDFFVGEEA